MAQDLPPQAPKTAFNEFLIAEYNNIAQAFFTTVNSISEFFKHYIVIMGAPISIAAIFLPKGVLEFLLANPLLPGILFTAITLIGLFVSAYVINLRFDAILYARTVNGIRKHFYESSGLDIEAEMRIRVLPKSTNVPRYLENRYFFFVILTFALVGMAYFTAGWYFYWHSTRIVPGISFWLFTISVPLLAHLSIYRCLARYREFEYLRGHIVGIDVDGVLNDHRTHFTEILKTQTGKKMHPDQITRIPVHEIPGANVTEADEHAVFNWPSYWTDMPPLADATRIIQRLRNLLGYKIWIFTHRGWPQPSTFPPGRENEYWTAWRQLSLWTIPSRWKVTTQIEKRLEKWGLPGFIRARLILTTTRKWLSLHGFVFDRLIVEKGNTDTPDPRFLTRNRFIISKSRNIRIFVEDDLAKAKRLADICEVVFLIDHPYNQLDGGGLPKNIRRVKSWQEIYQFFRSAL